jgi:hypothetical protein
MQPPAGLPRRGGGGSGGGLSGGTSGGGTGGGALGSRSPVTSGGVSVSTGGGGGAGRARIREAPLGSAVGSVADRADAPATDQTEQDQPASPPAPRQPWYQVVGPPPSRRAAGQEPPAIAHDPRPRAQGAQAQAAGAQTAQAQAAQTVMSAAGVAAAARDARRSRLPFAHPHPDGNAVPARDGRVNCGPLEKILWRQWEEGTVPPPQAVAAVERLASFPLELQRKLADGLTGIYVGAGGVPELDDMGDLRGVPLPGGRATWDACAGAYGEKKIVVGTRPSPTPDVVCHEVGHALDDLDSPPGKWQSDSAEFRLIYDQCQNYLASDFHRQRGGLGRKEFFADSFAAIASGQRPALVDMLSGNTRIALRVMLFFNRRYGI